jgi:hypothetical protein
MGVQEDYVIHHRDAQQVGAAKAKHKRLIGTQTAPGVLQPHVPIAVSMEYVKQS